MNYYYFFSIYFCLDLFSRYQSCNIYYADFATLPCHSRAVEALDATRCRERYTDASARASLFHVPQPRAAPPASLPPSPKSASNASFTVIILAMLFMQFTTRAAAQYRLSRFTLLPSPLAGACIFYDIAIYGFRYAGTHAHAYIARRQCLPRGQSRIINIRPRIRHASPILSSTHSDYA